MEFEKWIAVSESLPECTKKTDILFDEEEDPTRYLMESEQVLIYVHTKKNGKGYVDYGSVDEDGEWWEGGFADLISKGEDAQKVVTHWMKLPPAPSKEEVNKELKLQSKNGKSNTEEKVETVEPTKTTKDEE